MKRVLFAFALTAFCAFGVSSQAQTISPNTISIQSQTLNSSTPTVAFPSTATPYAPLDGMGTCVYTITSMGTSNVVTPKITQDPAMATYGVTYAVSSTSPTIPLATITTAGTYSSPCQGLTNFELALTTIGSGNVTISTMQATKATFTPPSPGLSTAAPSYIRLQDGTTSNLQSVNSSGQVESVICANGNPTNCASPNAPSSDGISGTLNGLNNISYGLGFNGTTWDRVHSGPNNADGISASATGALQNDSYLYAWNGSTFDRLQDDASKNLKVVATQGPANSSTSFQNAWPVVFLPGGIPYQALFTPNAGSVGTTCTSLSTTPLNWGVAVTNNSASNQSVVLTLYNEGASPTCAAADSRYSVTLNGSGTFVIPLPIAAWATGLSYQFSSAPANYVSITRY